MENAQMENTRNKDKDLGYLIPIDDNNEDNEEDDERYESSISWGREKWIILSNLLTACIPNCVLSKNKDTRQAWREKITFFLIFLLINAIFIFVIVFLPKLLCVNETVYTWRDIYNIHNDKQLVVVRGNIFDVGSYINIHPGNIEVFKKYLGQDISWMFNLPEYYQYKPSYIMLYPELLSLFIEYKRNDTERYCGKNYCHPFPNYIFNLTDIDLLSFNLSSFVKSSLNKLIIGEIALSLETDLNPTKKEWFILYNRVYNVSDYITYGHPVYPSQYDHITIPKKMAYYLDEKLNSTIMNRLGQDATLLFEENYPIYERGEIIKYLDAFYYTGNVDTRYSNVCAGLDIAYDVILGFIAGILGIKFILAQCMMRKQDPRGKKKYVIVFVPCYTENHDSIEKTIHSVYDSEYPDHKKLLFIVVDGVITGKGNDKSTAEITLNIFGRSLVEENNDTEEYMYPCTHEIQPRNKARVFSGWHTLKDNNIPDKVHKLPYIVVVKTGLRDEATSNRRGNRGKRDSQLILLNLLSKTYYAKSICPLENRLFRTFDDLNISYLTQNSHRPIELSINNYEYLLSVDADTAIDKHAINQMVYRMKDKMIYALCGETHISNKTDSWVTYIQVYEYYFNHNLNKAFESAVSSVTCLPGCFTMYRIKTDNLRPKPIIIHEKLLEEYSDNDATTMHKKNLLLLGEDRFFTTLMIKYFPKSKLKYIIEAKCETVAPNKWSILLSQRRRWINSTMHNLFKLMFVRMRGCCCFSMKFMVLIDLLTTMVLPSTCAYLIYLIVAFSLGVEKMNTTFIVMTSVILGIQIFIFMIRRDFIYIMWFILYLLALPIWMIFLPIYAFSKMDDFSWGNTRKIEKEEESVVNETI